MKLADIHIGDTVRIREWKDMASEFGYNRYGAIKCRFQFVKGMEPLCGKEFVVTGVVDGRVYSDGSISRGWSISADMLEPASSIEIEPFTDNELESLLNG